MECLLSLVFSSYSYQYFTKQNLSGYKTGLIRVKISNLDHDLTYSKSSGVVTLNHIIDKIDQICKNHTKNVGRM